MKHLPTLLIVLANILTAQSVWAQVEDLYQEAQSKYYSDASPEEVQTAYLNVAEMAGSSSLNERQIKMIHFSLLRLAQLTKGEKESLQWLKRAYEFAPQLEPEKDIFSPPLVASYQELKSPAPSAPMNSLPKSFSLKPMAPEESKPISMDQSLSRPLDNPSIWKNKWLWIGVGSLAAAYVIYENNRTEAQSPSPSTTYGF